jgi:hypothetical protein
VLHYTTVGPHLTQHGVLSPQHGHSAHHNRLGAASASFSACEYHGINVLTGRAKVFSFVAVLIVCAGACAARAHHRSETGTITIGVRTSGEVPQSSRFRVTIEPARFSGTVKADGGVVTKSGVPAGTHVIRLLDLPAQCRVTGDSQRTVTISQQRRSAVVRFDVVCG